jgi:hypothetical protein
MARLEFGTLWREHPLNTADQSPCRLPRPVEIGGRTLPSGYPAYANQCAIRLGVALRRAGVTIEQMGGLATCDHHPRSEMHVLNAEQTAHAIARLRFDNLGPMERLSGPDTAAFYSKLFGRRGLIYFADYWSRTNPVTGPDGSVSHRREAAPTGDHVDVWNGYRTTANWLMEWFSWLGYYHTYVKSREIWFWEIT